MPARQCTVSFTDAAGVTHSVDVTAQSLMEAVAFGLRDLRASGLTPVLPGPATQIRVRVRSASTAEHAISFRQFATWLDATARSPQERLLKDKLRQAANGGG